MKKLLSICAATMLLASCSNDDALSNQGTEQKVKFTVTLPDAVGSRAGGSDSGLGGISNTDDEGVTFSVALYHGDKATAAFTGNKTVNPGENTVTFEPVLVVGETYRIVAYAGFDGSIDMESRGATVNVNNAINDETQDMYFCSTDIVAESQMSATLKRPYGKLRIIAEDYAELNRQLDKTITAIAVAYKDGRQQTFNPESGLWEGDYTEANYTDAWTDEDAYANETGDARTILVDYIPTGVTGDDNVSFTVTVTFDDNTSFTRSFNEDIPVKRNYLTTLTGDFFTSTMDLKLNIQEAFAGEDIIDSTWEVKEPEYNATTKTYTITSDQELAWLSLNTETICAINDLTIELANDIYLNNRLWNGIRFWNAERPATFDGNGFTIHDLYINDNNALGLFGNPGNSGTTVNFKDLTIDGVTIEQKTSFVGSLAGNLYGDIENVHVKNVSVVADDNAKNIRYGGIIGLHNRGNATNCSVENITISGVYHNLGGMTGTINEASNRTYTNCYAKNVDLSIRATEGSGQYMVGALIGNVNGVKATLTGCYSINCNPTELVGYGTNNVTIEATKANGVKYANISEAISAGATEIELIGNVTEEYIEIGGGKEITLTGNGTFDGQFQVTGKLIANGVTFTNANASSDGISKKKDNVFYIQGEGVIELTNCTFNIEKATGITSWWSSASTNPSAKWNNIVLKNCIFNCNGNRPLQIEGNATIEGCTFNDPYRYCAQLTCGNINSETVVINFKNNTIGQASTSGKPTYGLQLTCDYGNSNMVINGEGNTIVDKGDDDAIYVYEEGTGISNGFVNIETITLNATDQNGWVVL